MTRQAPALTFVVLVAVGFSLWYFLRPDPQGNALRTREIATRGLAEYLARTHPGKKALVVSNPFTQRKDTAKAIAETEQAGIRGLRDGLGKSVSIAAVVFPPLKPGAEDNPRALLEGVETVTPLSYLMTSAAFDELARRHADCELIVSLVGVPLEVSGTEAWKAPGAPRFALLLPDLKIIGDAGAITSAMKSGKLAAFVLARPGAPDDETSPGKDWKAEFEKRFLLVTAENVEQVMQSYPELFYYPNP